MAERRRSAHAIDDQNNGGTLSAKKPRDPLSSYLYRSVVGTVSSPTVVHRASMVPCRAVGDGGGTRPDAIYTRLCRLRRLTTNVG